MPGAIGACLPVPHRLPTPSLRTLAAAAFLPPHCSYCQNIEDPTAQSFAFVPGTYQDFQCVLPIPTGEFPSPLACLPDKFHLLCACSRLLLQPSHAAAPALAAVGAAAPALPLQAARHVKLELLLPCMAAAWAPGPHAQPTSRPLFRAAFWILFVEFVGYFVLGIYLDHILPDENGGDPPPLSALLPPSLCWC